MTSLTELSVADNNLGPSGAQAIAEGIKATKSLKKLDISNRKGSSSGDIKSEGAKYIAEAIAVNASLTSIDLEWNKLGPEGAKALAPALRDSPSLTYLCLSYNDLTEESKDMLRASNAERDSPI
eukprot:CAMPEP_0181197378 /NCGR_PEP_ID=MMETSP1096-20121128/16006_1 /TAXON_ID=156174 ORGANISM="Chrysochromulina ericina, Strain CCMP281" /NCGR_SAMPLE_ID=MMETSP1096 /ASSEMBLY_ACC=CAM_ASM_000453 /LENGTH=123 /DNA_ID=CAMNT_0023287279 /DNA_START=33 /DNA_END=401 /DNA_ORIENTATION=+